MKNFCWIILASLFAFLVSCEKQEAVPTIDAAYCGRWGSSNYSLEIWQDGHGSYEHDKYTEDCKVFFGNGDIRFKVIDKFGNKIFHIDTPPFTDSLTGEREMKLDGEIYYKN
jgi:hypothetical protein